jgi:hypothetical protein
MDKKNYHGPSRTFLNNIQYCDRAASVSTVCLRVVAAGLIATITKSDISARHDPFSRRFINGNLTPSGSYFLRCKYPLRGYDISPFGSELFFWTSPEICRFEFSSEFPNPMGTHFQSFQSLGHRTPPLPRRVPEVIKRRKCFCIPQAAQNERVPHVLGDHT